VIAEALEAVWLVASALAAWIVAGVVAVTVGLYAVVVAGWGIWRVVVAAYVAAGLRRPQEPAGAPQGSSRVSVDAGAPSVAADGRTELSPHPSNPSAPARRPRSATDHHTPADPANARHTPTQRPSWARKDAA
jgi:hypothetical protein